MLYVFAIVPIFLLLGVAAQAPALYLATIAPAIFFWKRGIAQNDARFLTRISLAILGMWAVFPAVDLFHFFASTHQVQAPSLRTLLQSRLSSSVFGASVILLFTGLFSPRLSTANSAGTISGGRIVWWASMGLSAAVFALAPYFIFQSITGFSYHNISGHMDGREEYGLYRISGFFGNSLWVGSVTLSLFCFSWYLFWHLFAERTRGESKLRDLVLEPRYPWARKVIPWAILATAAGHFGFVLLSGGRTTITLAFFALVAIPFLVKMSPTGTLVRMWALGASTLVAAATIFSMGFAARIWGTMKAAHAGQSVTSRTHIWKVHFAIFEDFPLLGAGNNWLQAGIRDDYYKRLTDASLFVNFKGLLAHNLYIQILCDVGVIGFAVVAALFAYAAWLICSQVSKHFLPRTLGIAFALAFSANLLHGFTENTYFASNLSLVAMFLLLLLIWVSLAESLQAQVRH